MGEVLQFVPRADAAVEIKNVHILSQRAAPRGPERDDPSLFAMDDDAAPAELNPDPFAALESESD